jgi:hypothetical protein
MINGEAVTVYGMVSADYENVPEVAEAIWGAERADDGIGGGRAMTEGVIRLE